MLSIFKQKKVIQDSCLFDADFYINNYPEVKKYRYGPIVHYIKHGIREGKNPNSTFNTVFYLTTYKDVNINPLVHYILHGQFENRFINNFIEKSCFDFSFEQNNIRSSEYVEYKNNEILNSKIKLIAFYLPQYHPILENDKNWGKGFTEWTNVSKAVPQFVNHYQPRLPGELGFYDLRLIENQRRQIELAKNYGIYGFCYHYYWFDGKKIMDKPLQQILNNKDLDFPFCINWANENWTKKWDGKDEDIILKQNYTDENDYLFLNDLKDIVQDSRYIKINDKPIIMIYRALDIPKIKSRLIKWRNYLKDAGVGDVLFIMDNSFLNIDCKDIGFDYSTDFAPNDFELKTKLNSQSSLFNSNYQGEIYEYKELFEASIKKKKLNNFQSICLHWDNEARKPGKGVSFTNFSINIYKKWLEYIIYNTYKFNKNDERIVFFNAWNEWAEGTYLEPDRKYGYAYLDATYSILKKMENEKMDLIKSTQNNKKYFDTAVVIHMYYMDLWDEIKQYLKVLNGKFDLFININNSSDLNFVKEIIHDYPHVTIFSEENRGRDILPFIYMLKYIKPLNYKYVCKFHSKKSPHREDGALWRSKLIRSLLASDDKINLIKKELESDIGIVADKDNILHYNEYKGNNHNLVGDFALKAGINFPNDFLFPAGSMFWFNPKIFDILLEHVDVYNFEYEDSQLDNTYAHAIERLFGLLCLHSNKKIKGI